MLGISGIVRIFEEIEQRLIRSLKLNLGRHRKEEEQEEFDWSAWQAEKLRGLEKFRRENAAIMAEYTEQIDSETRQIMKEQFDEGMNGVDVPPAEPVTDVPAEIRPEPQFFGVDTTKVNNLIEDITYLEKNAETAALRLTDDVYRQTVNRVQLAMGTGSMTLQQAIDTAVKDFLDNGVNCIVYRDGRRVNIADYVRMALRTTATRAALQGKSAKYKALGYDTVQVSSYSMCSKTCEPWQGRIYIEDTFSMWDGEVREQGGILWGKSNYCGKWFPLLSSAIEKGLFHPNCRHSISLWRDGDPLPESVDNTDSERRYKLEQQQRALEREIRKAKRKVEGFTDPGNIRKAKAELRQAQKELKEFIDTVNADEGETVLKRDYGKEKVYQGEVVNNQSIDNSEKSGTIDIEVDEFVPCLKDAETGEILPTEVARIPRKRLREFTEADGWGVDWKDRPKDEYTLGVFLKGDDNPQGLISLRKDKGGIYMGFASTAPHNNKQISDGKQSYIGVGGHLFAAAIEESVKSGSGGYIYGFATNTKLLKHYIEDLGAYHFPMLHPYQFVIEGEAAQNLIDTYNYERRR